jgi:hypothetical protein
MDGCLRLPARHGGSVRFDLSLREIRSGSLFSVAKLSLGRRSDISPSIRWLTVTDAANSFLAAKAIGARYILATAVVSISEDASLLQLETDMG